MFKLFYNLSPFQTYLQIYLEHIFKEKSLTWSRRAYGAPVNFTHEVLEQGFLALVINNNEPQYMSASPSTVTNSLFFIAIGSCNVQTGHCCNVETDIATGNLTNKTCVNLVLYYPQKFKPFDAIRTSNIPMPDAADGFWATNHRRTRATSQQQLISHTDCPNPYNLSLCC